MKFLIWKIMRKFQFQFCNINTLYKKMYHKISIVDLKKERIWQISSLQNGDI